MVVRIMYFDFLDRFTCYVEGIAREHGTSLT